MITKRSIGICILLSILTCGIYLLYWTAVLSDDSNNILGYTGFTSGATVVLLTIVTCGIYGIFWAYKLGERMDQLRMDTGRPTGSLPVLYLILCILGLQIIVLALAQSELNPYAV